MLEPNEAGVSEATNQTPSAPQESADKQTTTQPRAEDRRVKEQGSHAADAADAADDSDSTQAMMDALGIDPAVQAAISEPPETDESVETEKAVESTAPTSETEATTDEAEAEAEAEVSDETDEDDETEQPAAPDQKPDKRQKRINRLTRQKGELETKLDLASAENQKLRDQLQGEKAVEPTAPTSSRSRLSGIMTEPALDKAIATAEGWVEWCDANADGVNQGEGDNAKFIGPKDIAAIRRENEKVILLAPNRRDQIRDLGKARSQFDTISQQAWPELWDVKSDEHKIGEVLEETYPFLKDIPARNYAIGLLVEGMKSLHARVQAAQKGNGKSEIGSQNWNGKPRAISEKAFGPRAPIAPSRPDAPTREVVPSSKKKLNHAMTDLAAGGGRDALVAAIAAMDEADAPNKSPSERLVKS